ncbi:MAG: hypothetical protein AAF532_09510 [Planctomycetota bacterium]
MAATVASAFAVLGLAAWSLSGLVSAADEDHAMSSDQRAATATRDAQEIPLVRYEGLMEIAGGEDDEQIVRVAEVELHGLVRGSQDELFLLSGHVRRRRAALEEAVDIVVRTAGPAELEDPENTALRDVFRDRVNAALGRDVVEDVVFTHFRVFDTPGLSL